MDAAKPVACSCSPLPNTFICCRIAGDQRGAIVEASSRRHLLSSSANPLYERPLSRRLATQPSAGEDLDDDNGTDLGRRGGVV